MDPITALGVAAAVVQFADFGSRLVSSSVQLYKSPTGRTAEEVELTTIANDLAQLGDNIGLQYEQLARAQPAEGTSESILLGICAECAQIAQDLDMAIREMRPGNSRRTFSFGNKDDSGSGFLYSKTKKIEKAINSFVDALRTVGFDSRRWREKVSDIRMRLMTATLSVLWEQSARGASDLQRLSLQQAEMIATLNRLEVSTLSFKHSLVQVIQARSTESTPERQAIINQIWSAADISAASFPDPNYKEPKSTYHLIDQHSERLLKRQDTEAESYVKSTMHSLQFQGIRHREDAIPEAYQRTFEWIFREPRQTSGGIKSWTQLLPWLEGPADDVYWVTGKPGAGKSTLMKFLTLHPRCRESLSKWSQDRPLVVASFYFWNAGASTLQKSQTGLLRALLLQCIEQMPSLAPQICPRRWALFKIFGSDGVRAAPQWSWAELLECFSALTLLTGDKLNLALFIDGLDEFEGDHQKLIDFVKLFHRRPGTKILISSRPWNIFRDAFATSASLTMEDFTTADIEAFVHGEFNRTGGYQELKEAYPVEAARLMTGIVQKAQGVFLWVSVVVRALREGLTEGDQLRELQSLLDTLPTDLSELYGSIWTRIRPEYMKQSSKLFQIYVNAKTAVDVLTLHLADMNPDEALAQDIVLLCGEKRRHIIQTMTRRLNSRTRGLLEVAKDGQVDYLHKSVREWTETKWQEICAESEPEFDPHLALLQALTAQISNPKVWGAAQLSFPTEFWNRACNCLYHASKVRDDACNNPPLAKIMDRLDRDLASVSTSYGTFGDRLSLYRSFAEGRLSPGTRANQLPHWSTTQYTMTPGSPTNTFVGLAAQFAVLPYVRGCLNRNPKLLLRRPNSNELPVLACAILGFQHFARPDIADLAEHYIDPSTMETRTRLVRLLLDRGALAACQNGLSDGMSPTAVQAAARNGVGSSRAMLNVAVQKRDFLRGISDDTEDLIFWEEVIPLLEAHMIDAEPNGKLESKKKKRLSLSGLLRGLVRKEPKTL